ncbi:putative ABC transporter involved in polysaccharide efflux [Cyanobium sp. PCC 7001]|nr:putative ABC transporter involved in polysaccharide efflux [Cyanobium sp. PCC 7001]
MVVTDIMDPRIEPRSSDDLDRGTIYFKNVTRRVSLGGTRSLAALDDVSITIPAGSRLALFADGMETSRAFLSCLAGHDPISSGTLLVGGCSSWVIGSRMPLMPSLSGRDNADFLISVYGVYDDDTRELDFIEKLCDLGELFDQPLEKYSSGMKDRFKLALSLAFQFDVYPVMRFDGWNCRSEVPFMQQVKRLVDRRLEGRTLIAEASGSQSFARDYCTTGIVFKDGQIILQGTPDECATLAKEVRAARKDRSLSRSLRQHSDVEDSLEDTMNELLEASQPSTGSNPGLENSQDRNLPS